MTEDEGGDTEPYKKLIMSLNAIIDKYRQLISSHTGKKDSSVKSEVVK